MSSPLAQATIFFFNIVELFNIVKLFSFLDLLVNYSPKGAFIDLYFLPLFITNCLFELGDFDLFYFIWLWGDFVPSRDLHAY